MLQSVKLHNECILFQFNLKDDKIETKTMHAPLAHHSSFSLLPEECSGYCTPNDLENDVSTACHSSCSSSQQNSPIKSKVRIHCEECIQHQSEASVSHNSKDELPLLKTLKINQGYHNKEKVVSEY